jgi:hypothetical protein
VAEPTGTGGFDLAAHLAALVIHALDDPARAPAAGWLAAFARRGTASVPLPELARARAALPAGPWDGGEGPEALMRALPVFQVESPGRPPRTEPDELAGQDWQAPDDAIRLFAALADRLPYLQERAERYLPVLAEWHGAPRPPEGLARVCPMYAALFNARLYLEAYKLLEMRWMVEQAEGPRDLLRGLMQVAVGLHQIESGRYAVPQLEEGIHRIRQGADAFPAPTLGRFLRRLERATRLLKAYGPDTFRDFDLELFPRLWMVSPWRLLFGLGRRP